MASPPLCKREIHVAPMLHVTTREFRQLIRILSRRTVLWTEMVVDELIFHNRDRPQILETFLSFPETQHPIVCQLGGIIPEQLGTAAKIAADFGYDEISLNVGCPSDRVSGKRNFGAVLMKQSDRCQQLVQAMEENCGINCNISVKCRLGVDDMDSVEELADFVEKLQPHCQIFYLHARKAILGKLSAVQNRSVPPLNYPRIYEICSRFPDCTFYLNGGVTFLADALNILDGKPIDPSLHGVPCSTCGFANHSCIRPPWPTCPPNLVGVMMGRTAMTNVAHFATVDSIMYNEPDPCPCRRVALERYCKYIEAIYPRRCADSDKRISHPTFPLVQVQPNGCCEKCLDLFNDCEFLYPYESSSSTKMSAKLLERALKPVNSMFYEMPGQKTFRRQLDHWRQAMPNCGPASIIRKSMQCLDANVLDEPFNSESHFDPRDDTGDPIIESDCCSNTM